jgi:hypothetical protein
VCAAGDPNAGAGVLPQLVPVQHYVRRRRKQKANRVMPPKKRVRFEEGLNIWHDPSRDCKC